MFTQFSHSYPVANLGLYATRCCTVFYPEQVEVLCASMGHSLGSVGGFCAGTEEVLVSIAISTRGVRAHVLWLTLHAQQFAYVHVQIVEHQRLSGSGYCFSASLPPYLATCASVSLRALGSQATQLLPRLHHSAAALRRELKKVSGGAGSPVHLCASLCGCSDRWHRAPIRLHEF
jgi:7-keto-8-aminopelargonate synthetase-like enzyme